MCHSPFCHMHTESNGLFGTHIAISNLFHAQRKVLDRFHTKWYGELEILEPRTCWGNDDFWLTSNFTSGQVELHLYQVRLLYQPLEPADYNVNMSDGHYKIKWARIYETLSCINAQPEIDTKNTIKRQPSKQKKQIKQNADTYSSSHCNGPTSPNSECWAFTLNVDNICE